MYKSLAELKENVKNMQKQPFFLNTAKDYLNS